MKSLLTNVTWRYCPTAENPADLLSRGTRTTTETLISSSLWNQGPKWLPDPAEWASSHLTPIPPLVLAAAVGNEFVPPEPVLPDTVLFPLSDTAPYVSYWLLQHMLFALRTI